MKSNETEHFKSKPVNSEQSTETLYVCLSSFQSENELKERSMAKHKEKIKTVYSQEIVMCVSSCLQQGKDHTNI